MAKLKITRATGEVTEHQITPGVEYAFELYKGKGFHTKVPSGTPFYSLAVMVKQAPHYLLQRPVCKAVSDYLRWPYLNALTLFYKWDCRKLWLLPMKKRII